MKKLHIEQWRIVESDGASVTSSSDSPLLPFLKSSKSVNEQFVQQLIKFICSSNISLRAVENPHFLSMMKLVSMKTPSRRNVGRMIRRSAEEIRMSQYNEVENAQHVVVGTDCWSTINATISLLVLTAHYLPNENSYIRKNIILDACTMKGRHTAAEIEKVFITLLPIKTLNEMKGVISDGASNLSRAFLNLKLKHFHCAAHVFNLAVNNTIKEPPLSLCLERMRKIIKTLKRSTPSRQSFEKKCGEKGVVYRVPYSDSPVRWSSTFTMIERFLSMETVFDWYMTQQNHPVFRHFEKELLRIAVKALKVFEEATLQVSKSNECVSCVLPMAKMILYTLEKIKDDVSGEDGVLVVALIKNCKAKFKNIFSDQLYKMACFIDPRYSYLSSLFSEQEWETIKQSIIDSLSVEETSTPSSQNSNSNGNFWQKFARTEKMVVGHRDQVSFEVFQFVNCVKTSRPGQSVDVHEWWQSHYTLFPTLSMLAKDYLCIPASSTDCERFFSRAGLIYNNKRRTLVTGENAKNMLLIAYDAMNLDDLDETEEIDDNENKGNSESDESLHSLEL